MQAFTKKVSQWETHNFQKLIVVSQQIERLLRKARTIFFELVLFVLFLFYFALKAIAWVVRLMFERPVLKKKIAPGLIREVEYETREQYPQSWWR